MADMKKVFVQILAIAAMVMALGTAVFAEDTPDAAEWNVQEPALQDTEMILIPDDAVLSEDEDDAIQQYDPTMDASSGLNVELQQLVAVSDQIRTALLNGSSKVDLSGLEALGILSTCQQFKHIGYYCPYLDGTNITASAYYYSDNTYAYVKIRNSLSAEDTKAWVERVDKALNNLLAVMDSSKTLTQQALALHDYMVSHYHYDTTNAHYYPGIILTQGDGVCQSYSYLFQYLMNRKGIECYTTASESMNHAWNILKIGTSYYHVDITWDDPIGGSESTICHQFFLLSDTTIQDSTHKHYGWNLTQYVCWDNSYESGNYQATEKIVYGLNSSSCYYKSVCWAAENNIVANSGRETFGVDADCTRAQAVTYIWRAAGKPSAPAGAKNPFSDVKSSDYYYEAVLWAVSKGITSGVSATSFAPAETCTRAQIISFINRFAGNATASGSKNPFTDVHTGDYFYNPVLWGVEHGIVYGVSTTSFAPNQTCTCAQIITFLYRYVHG